MGLGREEWGGGGGVGEHSFFKKKEKHTHRQGLCTVTYTDICLLCFLVMFSINYKNL
jgi:hypothetical protein